jgi:uncharacterized lipoprotein YmbA
MNTARKLLVIAAVLSLAACASNGTAQNYRLNGHAEIDEEYVAAVEDAARTAPVRVRVIWVNPPDAVDSDAVATNDK